MTNSLNIKNTDPARQDSPEISALYSEAMVHQQAGRLDPAYQLYRKILESNPEHADSLHRLGIMAEKMGRHENALDFLSRAIALKSNDPFYFNHLGNTLLSLGKLDEAAASYQRAIYLKDDLAEAYNNLGKTLAKQGKSKEALQQYACALVIDPELAEVYTNMASISRGLKRSDEPPPPATNMDSILRMASTMGYDYKADGFATAGKSLKFMEQPAFKGAWGFASEIAKTGWSAGVPDIRWRAHVAIWAAQNALRIEGDFVECGVHTAMLSLSLCTFLDFGSLKDRKIWLFDTWEGIPLESLSGNEKSLAQHHNAAYYKSDKVHGVVDETFSTRFPNSQLVKGVLPGSLKDTGIKKIAYLSMDLNNAAAEKACIDILWPRLTPGAFVVIDDYGWTVHRDQQDMWDNFAASQGRIILTLPTGQGLLVK